MRLTLWSVLGISVLVLLFVFLTQLWEQRSKACESEISYNDQTYNLKAATKLLNLEVGRKTEAVTRVSEILHIYIDQTRKLCEQYLSDGISEKDYRIALEDLGNRFAGFVQLQGKVPAKSVSDDEFPIYQETLEQLRPDRDLQQRSFQFQVRSDNRRLKSGAILHSGNSFHIEVDLPEKSYLYIVLLDAVGQVWRLYPTKLTGRENPIRGKVRVPRDPTGEFTLDEKTGTERIIIFAQASPSKAIEQELQEVRDAPNASTAGQGKVLSKAVQARGVFVEFSKTEENGQAPESVLSSLGQPAVEFLIDHR